MRDTSPVSNRRATIAPQSEVDMPPFILIVVVILAIYILINLMVDVLYVYIDPRIDYD